MISREVIFPGSLYLQNEILSMKDKLSSKFHRYIESQPHFLYAIPLISNAITIN